MITLWIGIFIMTDLLVQLSFLAAKAKQTQAKILNMQGSQEQKLRINTIL